MSGSHGPVFSPDHYASSIPKKIKRAFQLGPKYYLFDLPRHFCNRREHGLPFLDLGAILNPIREFRHRVYDRYPLPHGYYEALERFETVGIRFTIPPSRLEGLIGAWWAARDVSGDVIEFGSFRGATALFLAYLGIMNHVNQKVLMLDTFSGAPRPSKYDTSRHEGEFTPDRDQLGVIREQASVIGVTPRIEIHQGLFQHTIANLSGRDCHFAFAHIDANMYESTREACEFTIPRLAPKGIVVFDDYNGLCDLGARLAIDCYFKGRPDKLIPLAGSSVLLRKGS